MRWTGTKFANKNYYILRYGNLENNFIGTHMNRLPYCRINKKAPSERGFFNMRQD